MVMSVIEGGVLVGEDRGKRLEEGLLLSLFPPSRHWGDVCLCAKQIPHERGVFASLRAFGHLRAQSDAKSLWACRYWLQPVSANISGASSHHEGPG